MAHGSQWSTTDRQLKSLFFKELMAWIFLNLMFQAVYVSHLTCAVLACCGRRFSNEVPCASTAVATMTSASTDIWAKFSRAHKSISFVLRLHARLWWSAAEFDSKKREICCRFQGLWVLRLSPFWANKVKDNKACWVYEPSAAIVNTKLSECVKCWCCQRLKQSKGYF